MKKRYLILSVLIAATAAQARDLAPTGDLAPTQDLSTSADVLKPQVTPQRRDKTEELLRQMNDAGRDRAVQNTYQNQATQAGASTLTIPAGAIPGVQGAVTVTTPTGG